MLESRNHVINKHSHLSRKLDFGNVWFGIKCSENYFKNVNPIFDKLKEYKNYDKSLIEIIDNYENIYIPILNAFKDEFISLYDKYKKIIAERIVIYLLSLNIVEYNMFLNGKNNNIKIQQSFDQYGLINIKINNKRTSLIFGEIKLPTKIFDFSFKENSQTTLELTMNNGWAISFRIHNASTKVETSLKFDIQFLSLPCTLFYKDAMW